YTHQIERLIPKLVDTVSVASLSLWQQCTALGIDHKLVFQAPVGGDPDHFDPEYLDASEISSQYDFKEHIVTYMGQLHGAQYCSLFLQAASKLREQRDDVTYLVIGNGSQFLDLMKEAEELGLNDSIIFTGSVPHEIIPKFLKISDVCVAAFEDTPQVRTKSPLKVCEYMAAGKAIVASDVGEVSNMLDHGNAGILVPAGDPLPLASGIQKILNDPDLKKHLEYNARQRSLDKYNWTKTA
ncbi:glycosyltransferase, partial [bacterium]|nr:glycosyltransferase [bacterium]